MAPIRKKLTPSAPVAAVTKKGSGNQTAPRSPEIPAHLKELKTQFTKRQQELEQELKELTQDKFSDDQVQDPGDQALSSTMETLKSSFQNSKLDEYRRLTLALQMIEDGNYGICIDCQAPISEKRLKLFPNATRCLACQELYEEHQEEGGQ